MLLMLPLLWMMPETRRTAWKAFAIYALVSLAFVAVPLLNPDSMDWSERISLATHPAMVQQTMNVYTNGFTVTPPMKDNAVHWFAMQALADYRLMHINVCRCRSFSIRGCICIRRRLSIACPRSGYGVLRDGGFPA